MYQYQKASMQVAMNMYTARNVTDMQVVDFTGLMQVCRLVASFLFSFSLASPQEPVHSMSNLCKRKLEYPEKTHDFRQSYDLHSFHMKTLRISYGEWNPQPASSLLTTCGIKPEPAM